MFRYNFIILIICNITYTSFSINKFINYNQNFLNNHIKYIEFEYQPDNIDNQLFLNTGFIIIGKDNYKVTLDNNMILFNDSHIKRYNKITNQIFIEDSIPYLDSLILNFFNLDYLDLIRIDSMSKIFISPIDFSNAGIDIYLNLSSDSLFIQSINIEIDQLSMIDIYNIKFSDKYLELTEPFIFNFPGALTFDLRD